MKYTILSLLIPFTLFAQTPATAPVPAATAPPTATVAPPAAATTPDAAPTMVQGYPSADMSASTNDQVDKQAAINAYKLWYPTVSNAAAYKELNDKGIKDNTTLAYFNADPDGKIFTANQDTPYGLARFDLKEGPMVIEMPAGPFIGLVNDIHQRWVTDLGLPGEDKGKGGKYLIVPPGYKGKLPKGYFIKQARVYAVLPAFRVIPQGGDLNKALEELKKIKFYPLSKESKPPVVTYKKLTGKYDMTIVKWEDQFQYWVELKKIVDSQPVVEDMASMYGFLTKLGIEKDKPFVPDERMKKILMDAAKEGKNQMLVSAFANSRKEKMVWPDRKWEWVNLLSEKENVDFMTKSGIDLDARERWFAQAVASSPSMFLRKEGSGSLYWMTVKDQGGNYLNGAKTYRVSVPLPVPANLFWSITLYDTNTRSLIDTDQNRAAIRSLVELKDAPQQGTIDLYFGPQAPTGMDKQWIKTTPGKSYFAYFRVYGPEKKAFDGSWKPSDFQEEVILRRPASTAGEVVK
jgi:hypothetical protein